MDNMTIYYSAATVRGQRESNQDNLRVGNQLSWGECGGELSALGEIECGSHQLFCVCDGVGGGYLGELAAMLALEAVEQVATAPDAAEKTLEQLVTDAARTAHAAVCGYYQKVGRSGGCTMTLLGLSGGQYILLNIGDSPCFLIRKGQPLRELSVRHNLYWHKRRLQVEPEDHDANLLMRFLGKANCSVTLMADRVSGVLEPGDQFLLCSDGITNAISEQELNVQLRGGVTAEALAERAAEVPGADNCTAIVLQVGT